MVYRSSALSDRLSRLEHRIVQTPSISMNKEQRDALVHRFVAAGDFTTLLGRETEQHRRAVIEAAMRADH
jgi:hypothetical protein